ncbi:LIM and SH3 domain protein 1 [Balamuthia mandrillaris]
MTLKTEVDAIRTELLSIKKELETLKLQKSAPASSPSAPAAASSAPKPAATAAPTKAAPAAAAPAATKAAAPSAKPRFGGGGTKCAACNKTVYSTEEFKAMEKTWHKPCFRCASCNVMLQQTNYHAFEDQPYCKAHYVEKAGGRI